MSPEEATWEATRLNIILANKGYSDSDVTRWWNFTRHRELDDRTIAEAWSAGDYGDVSRLIESLPDKHGPAAAPSATTSPAGRPADGVDRRRGPDRRAAVSAPRPPDPTQLGSPPSAPPRGAGRRPGARHE